MQWSVTADTNEDTRALRELAPYGVKGIAAYGDHAMVLGYEDNTLYRETARILGATLTMDDHFVGNYGNSWWVQDTEFASFNGPILMTTNCITSPKDSYQDRIFTTGLAGFPGVAHIPDRGDGSASGYGDSHRRLRQISL